MNPMDIFDEAARKNRVYKSEDGNEFVSDEDWKLTVKELKELKELEKEPKKCIACGREIKGSSYRLCNICLVYRIITRKK